MRYIPLAMVLVLVASVSTSCGQQARIAEQDEQIATYKAALEKINSDMQINYAFQQATLMDLAECMGDK